MDAVTKLRQHADELEAAERELSRLEEKASELRARVADADAQRDAAESAVEALQETIAGLEEERSDLKVELFDAWAYGKTSEQQRLKKRMNQVQDELEKANKERDDLLVTLEEIDTGYDLDAAVEVAVTRDRVKLPSAYDVADEIRLALVRDLSALQSRKPSVPGEGTEAFEAARRAADAEYDSRKRFEESKLDRLASRVAANDALTEAGREARANPRDTRNIDPVTGLDKAGARYRARVAKTTV